MLYIALLCYTLLCLSLLYFVILDSAFLCSALIHFTPLYFVLLYSHTSCFSLLYSVLSLFSPLCIRPFTSSAQPAFNRESTVRCAKIFSKCGVLTAFHTGGVRKYAKYSAACSSVGSEWGRLPSEICRCLPATDTLYTGGPLTWSSQNWSALLHCP